MDNMTKVKNIFLKRLKHQIWCDLVIGRSDNNKVQWSDKNIKKYINNMEHLLDKCVEDIFENEEDLNHVDIREYLYELCNTYYGLEYEKNEFDQDKHDWRREPSYFF